MCYVTYSWKDPDSLEKLKDFQLGKKPTGSLLEITSKCNFSCIYCYLGYRTEEKDMSFNDIKKVIDILSKSNVRQVTLTGGEPLLHPNILNIVKYSSDKGLIVHLCTNGYLLSEDLAKKLAKNGLTQIQTDIIYTESSLHDELRGKKDSFEKAGEALINAKKAGITTVATIVLNQKNKGVINGIIQYARKQMGVDRIRIIDYMPIGIYRKSLILENYASHLKRITNFVIKLGAKNLISFEPTFPNKNYKPKIKVIHIPCPNKDSIFVNIKTNGDVIFCACASRDKVLYNIFHYKGKNLEKIHIQKINEFLEENKFEGCFVHKKQ